MCYKADSQTDVANTWAFIATFTIWKTLVYATPAMVKNRLYNYNLWTVDIIIQIIQFLFFFFPADHFSALYGCLQLPSFALFWRTDPLFKLILNGDDIADAEYCEGFRIDSKRDLNNKN